MLLLPFSFKLPSGDWQHMCFQPEGQRKSLHVTSFLATFTRLFPPGGCERRAGADDSDLKRRTERQGWKTH